MLTNNDRINNLGIFFLTVAILIETGVLAAPRTLTEEVRSDAWLAVIFILFAALTSCFFIVRLSQLFPGEHFTTYIGKIIGKTPGILLSVGFILYWLLNGGRIIRTFTDIIKTTLLFRTPIEVIILTFLLISAYLARGGIEPMVRFSTIAVIASVPTGAILVAATFKDWNLSNLLPIFDKGFVPVLSSGLRQLGLIEGLESLLFLIPFARKPGKSLPYCFAGVLVVHLLLFLITLTSLLDFGTTETMRLTYPGISLIQSVEIPGRFLERLGSIYVTIWILILFPTIVFFLYLPSLTLSQVCKKSEYRPFVLLLLPIIYLVAMLPANTIQLFEFSKDLTLMNLGFLGIIPPSLYAIARIRGYKHGRR
jgi:spore germination protein